MREIDLEKFKSGDVAVPADLRKALAAAPRAKAQWESVTRLARRDWILWIVTAKQAKTRERRVERACDMLASGKRRPCCFGGVNWLIRESRKRRG